MTGTQDGKEAWFAAAAAPRRGIELSCDWWWQPCAAWATEQRAGAPEELAFPFTLNTDTRFTYMQTIPFHPP